jgi:Putative beta-barrel porin-2, OmpL-like. bbp2
MLAARRIRFILVLAVFLSFLPSPAGAQTSRPDATSRSEMAEPQSTPAIFQGLEVGAWGWLSAFHTSADGGEVYWSGEGSLSATKSFNGQFAISAQGDFIDADNQIRGELEQGYATLLLSDRLQTALTVGKFNADIGVEARDFWNRSDATTSLIFGAVPQDMVGIMITQPLPGTDIKLRPFVAEGIEGSFDFGKPPSGGLIIEYQPCDQINIGLTNWLGPGYTPVDWSESEYYEPPALNWMGPQILAPSSGILYLLDANATWNLATDLSLAAEFVYAANSSSPHDLGWTGFLVQGNYTLTENWRVFARWSYLDDAVGLITSDQAVHNEISGGVAWSLNRHLEVRAEYRHDFSTDYGADDLYTIDLTFGF